MKVDPWIGSWADLTSLCESAKSKGIKVLADCVFNHTGTNSIYYNDERYKDWYKKDENGNQMFWWGFKDLAEVDTRNEDYQKEMSKVIEKYLKCGIAGIRFDLGEGISKEFYYYISKLKEKYPGTVYIGEMWDLATTKQDPKIYDGQLDSIMNYPMSDAILRWIAYGNCDNFNYKFNTVYTKYPKQVQDVLLNNIGTHDTPLPTTMLANIMLDENRPIMNPDPNLGLMWDIEAPWRKPEGFDTHGFRKFEAEHDRLTSDQMDLAKKLTKIAISLLYFIPGVPCLLQGTEIADSGFKDPFCRKPYNWDNQDQDMQNFVRLCGKMRKANNDILKHGDVDIASINESVLILERYRFDGHRAVMAVNRTNSYQEIGIKNDCDNLKILHASDNSSKTKLAPYGILVAREN